jgi:hypothetical protein
MISTAAGQEPKREIDTVVGYAGARLCINAAKRPTAYQKPFSFRVLITKPDQVRHFDPLGRKAGFTGSSPAPQDGCSVTLN